MNTSHNLAAIIRSSSLFCFLELFVSVRRGLCCVCVSFPVVRRFIYSLIFFSRSCFPLLPDSVPFPFISSYRKFYGVTIVSKFPPLLSVLSYSFIEVSFTAYF